MQQNETSDIRLRPDGSIDTAHYMNIGRQKRADQAKLIAKRALPKSKLFSRRVWPLRAFAT